MNVATRLRQKPDPRRAHKPTSRRVRDNILSEKTFQSGQISLLGNTDKGLQKSPLLARNDGCAPTIGDMLTGTGDELAGVCFLQQRDKLPRRQFL
jgi:hypothetical protein